MKMTLIVAQEHIGHFKTALDVANGWHVHNPMKMPNTDIMVHIAFSDNPSVCRTDTNGKSSWITGYEAFWQIYNDLTKTIVEIDNRKWYTKYLNRFRIWFKK